MTANVTSFRKKASSKVPYIVGSKPSIQNSQLLVSCGVPSLDSIVGGGLAVGTMTLLEEDTYGTYAKLLTKYYLAEGVMCNHSLLVASLDTDPNSLIAELPRPVSNEMQQEGRGGDEKMKIAWRYENLSPVQSSFDTTTFGHHYDLTTKMDEDKVKSADIKFWRASGTLEEDGIRNSAYEDLLQEIQKTVEEGKYSKSAACEKRNLLRIAIQSAGSPLWTESEKDHWNISLTRFLYCLRAVLRSAYAVCLVTVPSHLFMEPAVIQRCQHLSDVAVRLESFVGSDKETNPAFKDYHGLFHLNKLPALNTLAHYIPDSFDLAFKLKRKRFVIEKLHLPPELSETTQREQDDIVTSKQPKLLGCGSASGGRNLDF